MIDGEQAIESNLHKQLTEHLNAEIVLRTITDLGVALQWLTSTFLYIRARKHPKYYGLPLGLSQDQIDRRLLGNNHVYHYFFLIFIKYNNIGSLNMIKLFKYLRYNRS